MKSKVGVLEVGDLFSRAENQAGKVDIKGLKWRSFPSQKREESSLRRDISEREFELELKRGCDEV